MSELVRERERERERAVRDRETEAERETHTQTDIEGESKKEHRVSANITEGAAEAGPVVRAGPAVL